MDPSTPAGAREEKRRSIGNYFKRMKTVLRRRSLREEGPSAAPEEPPPSTTEVAPPAPVPDPKDQTPEPEPTQDIEAPTASKTVIATTEPELVVEDDPHVEPVMEESTFSGFYVHSLEQRERARLLFARYGLHFNDDDFIAIAPTISVQRIERPVRMRVHRNCHRCQTTFGADKTCVSCQHRRCKKCPRYPRRKPKDQAAALQGDAPKPDPDVEKAKRESRREPLMLRRQGEAQDLIHQPPRQRIRRVCHKCDALFTPPSATVCTECGHVRCSKCPRQPSKQDQYPHGYPGDAPAEASDEEAQLHFPYIAGSSPPRMYRKPRLRVRWTCEHCQTTFKKQGAKCQNCNHEQCDNCTRFPSKKTKQADPDVVRSINEKLAQLKVEKSTEAWVAMQATS